MSSQTFGPLYREHLLLNAVFEDPEDGNPPRPATYPGSMPLSFVREGAFLVDLTGATYALLHGAPASQLAGAAFCGRTLGVGECAFEPSLTGDASVNAIPLCLRTGDSEYVLLDPTDRGETLVASLGFLANLEPDGCAPYAGTEVESAQGMLVPLLLCGAKARDVLADYVKSPSDLPRPGRVTQIKLDSILCVVAAAPLPHAGVDAFLVFVSPAQATILWRSFLSFQEVSPAGTVILDQLVRQGLPWGEAASSLGRVEPGQEALSGWGLLRPGSDFIGARAFSGQR